MIIVGLFIVLILTFFAARSLTQNSEEKVSRVDKDIPYQSAERKIFLSTDFRGFWDTTASAVIVASTEAEAVELLKDKLYDHGKVAPERFTVEELDTNRHWAKILTGGSL